MEFETDDFKLGFTTVIYPLVSSIGNNPAEFRFCRCLWFGWKVMDAFCNMIATAANILVFARCQGEVTWNWLVLASNESIHLPACIGPRIGTPATFPSALMSLLLQPLVPLQDADGFMAFACVLYYFDMEKYINLEYCLCKGKTQVNLWAFSFWKDDPTQHFLTLLVEVQPTLTQRWSNCAPLSTLTQNLKDM